MKRSFLTVLAASSVFVLGACAGDDSDVEIQPVEDIQPAPAPAPAPMPIDTMMGDTLIMSDTLTTTGL